MGNEVGTVAGAVGTAATSVAAGVTFGQVEGINRAVVSCASYTADKAANTSIRHVGEAAGVGVATVACGVAAGVTLGQVEGVNKATVACANHASNSATIAVTRVADSYNPLNIPKEITKVVTNGYTRDLDRETLVWLAECASGVYSDEPTVWVTSCLPGNFGDAKIYTNEKTGKTCLAIRGTDDVSKWIGNIGVLLADVSLMKVKDILQTAARANRVDYVTGHSQGGLLAEAIASSEGIDGASFNSPGGRTSLLFGAGDGNRRWTENTRYEVHLNGGDVVSSFRTDDHIAQPKWHKCRQDGFAVGGPRHSMKEMLRDIRRGN